MTFKNKTLKILIISPYSVPFPGAPWRRIEYFANFLSDRGGYVIVIGAITLRRDLLKILKDAKKYYKFRIFNFFFYINLLNWLAIILNLLGSFPLVIIILILKPEIILVSIPYLELLPITFLAAKLINSRFIVDIRDPLEYWVYWSTSLTRKFYSLINLINYAVLSKSDLNVTVTFGLARLLAKRGIRAEVVVNGADIRVFRPYHACASEARRKLCLSDNAVVLVFSGRLGGYYDATPLLQAVARLPAELKKKVVLLLVGGFGDAIYAKKFIRVAKELRLFENIKVLQPILDARTLAEVLSAANAGVVTHVASELYDPAIPVKFYEYLACELPVIALTRRGSELWRLITKWGVGFACEPHDLDCITKALEKIFDESTMESIRANVLRVRPLIDRRRAAEKLYNLLCELLEPRRDA